MRNAANNATPLVPDEPLSPSIYTAATCISCTAAGAFALVLKGGDVITLHMVEGTHTLPLAAVMLVSGDTTGTGTVWALS